MESTRQVTFRVFSGPNLVVPFTAAIAEFSILFTQALPRATILRTLDELLPSELQAEWNLAGDDIGLANLSQALAAAYHDWRGPTELPIRLDRLAEDRYRLSLGYYDADTALTALQLGIELANAAFTRAQGAVVNSGRLQALARRMNALLASSHPEPINRAMMRIARTRDIPIYALGPATGIWMYGQGARARHFFVSITERESFIGVRLVLDKIKTNRHIHRLGLPGAQFGIAESAEMARDIAHRLGFPVAVKPSDRDKGVGITLAIDNDGELDAAFALAKDEARNGMVIIERYYQGDHHRLSVFGGKFKRATQLRAAHIIGDGVSTVDELIKSENASRTDADVAAGFVKRLTVDSDMLALLGKQGYGLGDRPPVGTKLQLRKTSNIAAGGKLRDVSSLIHPDNIAMAEALARNFWLDAAGIDFVAPDIGVSWREVPCAVVEVNSPPGITSDFLAEKALSERFPPGQNGRIPCILIVGDDGTLARAIVEKLATSGLCVGRTDATATTLGDQHRHVNAADIATRVMSLLLDPACEALVVACSAGDIERHGVPHTRYDLVLIAAGANVPESLRTLLGEQVQRVVESATPANLDASILPGNVHTT